jgi:hypothetical protein
MTRIRKDFIRGVLAESLFAAPVAISSVTTAPTGGSLAAASYSYRISALSAAGETLASLPGTVTSTGATSVNTVSWTAVPGATGYKVYGRTTGAELLMATLGLVLTYADTGAVTPTGALPSSNTFGADYGTIRADAIERLPAIGVGDHLALCLNPQGDPQTPAVAPEIVWMTSHDALSDFALVLRAQEGTVARFHAVNEPWSHSVTAYDVGIIEDDFGTHVGTGHLGIRAASPTIDVFSSGVTADVFNRFILDADGTMWGGDGITAPGRVLWRGGQYGQSIAIGRNAISVTAPAGDFNTAIGASALRYVDEGDFCTAVGSGALQNNLSGDDNTAVGRIALFSNETGDGNTAVGSQALENNTIGADNVAMGFLSLNSNTSGGENTAVGATALRENVGGTGNVAAGYEALLWNVAGSYNTAVGTLVLQQNLASNNTAMGFSALEENTTGFENTAVGVNALEINTTGYENTAIGSQALALNSTGDQNVAIGGYGLATNVAGNENTAVGHGALYSTTVGGGTAVGWNALANNTTGQFNVGMGHSALRFNQTGANNTAVGHSALTANDTGSYNTALGTAAMAYGTDGTRCTAVGFQAFPGGVGTADNTAVGANAYNQPAGANFPTTTGLRNTGLGSEVGQSTATQRNDTVAVGYRALVNGNNAIAIGSGVLAGAAGAVAIGKDSAGTSASTTTADQIVLGTALHSIEIPGVGIVLTAPNATRYRITVDNSGALTTTAL